MKVKYFKGELKSRRLLKIGRKAELQDRLIRAIKDKVPIAGVVEDTKNKYGRPKDGRPKQNTNQLSEKEFPKTAHWQPLIPLQTMVEEPINPSFRSQATRATTIDKEYESFVPIKQNFAETFNRPSFDGTYGRVEKTRRDNIKRGKDGNRVKTKQPRKKGIVREDFLEKHGLSHHSAPVDFVSPFLPFKCNGYSTHRKEQISFDFFARWKNLKAKLAGAGEVGSCYYDW